MSDTQAQPLYSDERIKLVCSKLLTRDDIKWDVRILLTEMRDNYERDRAFWANERATNTKVWMPVPDGNHGSYELANDEVTVWHLEKMGSRYKLPKGTSLCHLVDAPPVAAMPEEVRQTIRLALEYKKGSMAYLPHSLFRQEVKMYTVAIDAALRWLDMLGA